MFYTKEAWGAGKVAVVVIGSTVAVAAVVVAGVVLAAFIGAMGAIVGIMGAEIGLSSAALFGAGALGLTILGAGAVIAGSEASSYDLIIKLQEKIVDPNSEIAKNLVKVSEPNLYVNRT